MQAVPDDLCPEDACKSDTGLQSVKMSVKAQATKLSLLSSACHVAAITDTALLLQPALEELAVQNVGCSVNACKSLAELVQHAQDLRTLRLYNNMSDDAGATSIAEVQVPP